MTKTKNNKKENKYMNTKKTAYYQIYDSSVLESPDYCVKEDMCDDIASLEDDIFEFGKDMVKLSKTLDSLDKQEIAAKIQAVVDEHCGDYLESNDSIANLDEYEGLKEHEEDEYEEDEEEYEDEDEDEDEDEEDEYEEDEEDRE